MAAISNTTIKARFRIREKLLRIKANPRKVSLGYALGVFRNNPIHRYESVYCADHDIPLQMEQSIFRNRGLSHQYIDSAVVLWILFLCRKMDSWNRCGVCIS